MNRWMRVLVMAASLGLGHGALQAREWKSSDGSRTMQAKFVSQKGDQLTLTAANGATRTFPATAFSAEDQKFASNAQAVADAAAKWGPQSFEVSQIVEGGRICRLALPPAQGVKGPPLFSGEMLYLMGEEASKSEQGAQFTSRMLFGAGGRTFHPLKGEPMPIRAFALDVEEATQAWMDTVGSGSADPARLSPPVVEPEIEVVTTRGVGIALAKNGLFVTDAALTKDADTVLVFLDGDGQPAKVIKTDEKLGLAFLSCALTAEPPRIGSKKPAELGQQVYAMSFELSANKRSMTKTPIVTHGVISRFGDAKQVTFEHDARVSPESIGGYVIGLRGEVLGLFFRNQSTTRALASKRTKAADIALPPVFSESVSTAALGSLLGSMSGVPSMRMSPTETDMQIVAKDLLKGTALIVATKEARKTREPAVAKASPQPNSKPPAKTDAPTPPAEANPPTGWSLSKSGTRHNAKCRFYDPKLPCTAADGKACKICGG